MPDDKKKSSDGQEEKSGDKRVRNRTKRRLMVKYGTSAAEKTAFTKNVSETGLFVHTNAVFKPGTTIQVHIEFPSRTFSMWAKVVWAKKVPPQLAHVLECGMGLCFVEPSAEWLSYFRDWSRKLQGL